MKGKVYLIGAGPGDPALLTCRAKQLLAECDVVCYDKLVSAAILSTVPAGVKLHQIGYRGYQGSHITYGMHPEVMEFALAGKNVARLKSGDPAIFGRLTEECRELNQHGVEYEIIPGISAALGAAAYSGFPLTSGKIASSVTFVSGHQHLQKSTSLAEQATNEGTIVLYMGAKKLAEHAQSLIDLGRDPDTAVAFICSASRSDHQCITGTLTTIAEKIEHFHHVGPALVVIGDVVAQQSEFDWRKAKPLANKRILICGHYHSEQALRECGAELIVIKDVASNILIDEEDLHYFSQQAELAFKDLATFKLWWQALIDNQWDIRRFTMPLTTDNPEVKQAMSQYGIIAKPISSLALKLTLDNSKVFDPVNNEYQIARRSEQPLGYQIPKLDWILVEDAQIAQLVYEQQADRFNETEVITVNNDAKQWAIDSGLTMQSEECVVELISGQIK